jgi:hypothetical protein
LQKKNQLGFPSSQFDSCDDSNLIKALTYWL